MSRSSVMGVGGGLVVATEVGVGECGGVALVAFQCSRCRRYSFRLPLHCVK
jgi:hypothetical protein